MSKHDFTEIWNLIETLACVCGAFQIRRQHVNNSYWHTGYQFFCVLAATGLLLMIISTSFYEHQNFSMFVLGISTFICCLFGSMSVENCKRNKDMFWQMMQWCHELYSNVDQVHPPQVKCLMWTNLKRARETTIRVVKLTTCATVINGFAFAVMPGIIGQFLPENVYPKYKNSFPFYLPLEHRNNWIVFGITLSIEAMAAYFYALAYAFSMSFCSAISIHMYMQLNSALEIVKELKMQLESQEIKQKRLMGEEESVDVSSWLKLVVQITSSVQG